MIFLDTWIWMEFFKHGNKYIKVLEILKHAEKFKAAISAPVLTELKYKLSKEFDVHLANNAVYFIETFENLLIVPTIKEVAKLAADLRLKYYSTEMDLSYIDTINLATAVLTNCDTFYTGDPDFSGVDEIKIVII